MKLYTDFFYHLLCFFVDPFMYVGNLMKLYKKQKIVKKLLRNYPHVSIIVLTHNALEYVQTCVRSLQKTSYKKFEIIVVDNASKKDVQEYLVKEYKSKHIDKLVLLPKNVFFAKGNNIGARCSKKSSKYLLFLNSDTEIKNPDWLNILVSNCPPKGIISWGYAFLPILRPDGWCFLTEKERFFDAGLLNEKFPFNWSITELTTKMLKMKSKVKVLVNPDKHIVHFGGKSRKTIQIKKVFEKNSKLSISEVIQGFRGHSVGLLSLD